MDKSDLLCLVICGMIILGFGVGIGLARIKRVIKITKADWMPVSPETMPPPHTVVLMYFAETNEIMFGLMTIWEHEDKKEYVWHNCYQGVWYNNLKNKWIPYCGSDFPYYPSHWAAMPTAPNILIKEGEKGND